jgi:hypothetical protein
MVDPTQPAQGMRLRVKRFVADGTYPSDLFVGMCTEAIDPNEIGIITWFGQVRNLDLTVLEPSGETWAEGDILWPNPSVAGGMSNVEPTAPALKITVAAVLRITGNQLNVLLRPNLRSKVADLHDVQLTTPSNGQVLRYNSGVFENDTLDAGDVGAIPTSEKGVANGVATLDADAFLTEAQMRINTTTLRHRFAPIAYPDTALVFWDDFQDASAEVNGRISPSGGTWAVRDVDGVTTLGEYSVAGGRLVKPNTAVISATSAGISISEVSNGLFVETMAGVQNGAASAFLWRIYNASGDSVTITIDATYTITKRVSGTTTTVSALGSVNYPSAASGDARMITNFTLAITKQPTLSRYVFGVSASGGSRGFLITDTDVISIMDNATHIGIAANRSIQSYGIRIIRTLP